MLDAALEILPIIIDSMYLDAGLRKIDVAKKLKRTQSYVSRVEVGEQRLDILELQKFAKLYNKPLDYFVK